MMLQLIKDLMSTLCVQCKQTRADGSAGSSIVALYGPVGPAEAVSSRIPHSTRRA